MEEGQKKLVMPKFSISNTVLGVWRLTPLSTIVQFYRGDKLY